MMLFHLIHKGLWKITDREKLFSEDWGKIRNCIVNKFVFV